MPVYEYECPDCGFEFEKHQKFTDPPVKHCPNCGRRKVYRVVSKVAVTFKGSGFYITDSKSSDAKHTATRAKPEDAAPATAESSDTKTADAAGEAKTEAATETKADAKAEAKAAGEAKAEAKPDKSDAAPKKKAKASK